MTHVTDSRAETVSPDKDTDDLDEEVPTGPVQDDRFGDITVLLNDEEGWVEVLGDAIPPATVDRAPEAGTENHVPIGTRDGDHLTMTVDGEPVALVPGKGKLSRRSYAVDVTRDGVVYRLVPDSIAGSRLLKDGQHLGDFSSDGDGRVLAEWKEGAEVSPADASVGYALAAAFGTGGQPMWMMAIEAAAELLPG
ncbi:hypothetical protein [Streptomyces roseoverticillatus]|uniref:hypothetical protein n=1 Tax=Streptomyces roseoverticillatus TaxID=66429 RepID=UPI000A670C3A|nr:hypothetical protein [Streptomyces roseoverticillatus]